MTVYFPSNNPSQKVLFNSAVKEFKMQQKINLKMLFDIKNPNSLQLRKEF
jgi:hypothetical protein